MPCDRSLAAITLLPNTLGGSGRALLTAAKGTEYGERIYTCIVSIAPEELDCILPDLHPIQCLDIRSDIGQINYSLPCHLVNAMGAATLGSQISVVIVALVIVVPPYVDTIGP